MLLFSMPVCKDTLQMCKVKINLYVFKINFKDFKKNLYPDTSFKEKFDDLKKRKNLPEFTTFI